MINEALFSSNSDEWTTPDNLFKELDAEFHFDIDVAASSENAKCKRYYDLHTDGLKQDWQGTCWCNPPYSQIAQWVQKAHEEARKGNATTVMLIPSRTDTRYFHQYIYEKHKIRFIKGRLKFSNSKNSAPFPSMIVIFDKEKNIEQTA